MTIYHSSNGVNLQLANAAALVFNFVPFLTKQAVSVVRSPVMVVIGLSVPISTLLADINDTYPIWFGLFIMYTYPLLGHVYVLLTPIGVPQIQFSNLPFSVVDQTAGAAVRAPERSPHGLHKV